MLTTLDCFHPCTRNVAQTAHRGRVKLEFTLDASSEDGSAKVRRCYARGGDDESGDLLREISRGNRELAGDSCAVRRCKLAPGFKAPR